MVEKSVLEMLQESKSASWIHAQVFRCSRDKRNYMNQSIFICSTSHSPFNIILYNLRSRTVIHPIYGRKILLTKYFTYYRKIFFIKKFLKVSFMSLIHLIASGPNGKNGQHAQKVVLVAVKHLKE